jgi:mono/diheme cytochrome c family protein
MPAYAYEEQQVHYVRSFLQEIDRPDVGRGQLRLGDPSNSVTPQAAFDATVRASAYGDELEGFETFSSGICSACHFPFQASIVGAPDLSTVVERLDTEDLMEVLTTGRPEGGMPPPSPTLSVEERDYLIHYLGWLNQNRSDLMAEWEDRQSERSIAWSRLDWWEFR